jgi:hypothetical protein
MTSCGQIESNLVKYLNKALSPTQAKAVEGHLAACPTCAEQLKLLRLERALLQATWLDERSLLFSPHFVARLKNRFHEEVLAERPGFWDLVWNSARVFAVGATMLIILISGLNLYTNLRRPVEIGRLEGVFMESPDSDSIGLILQEGEKMTSEQVLSTLVLINGGEHDPSQ